MKDKSYGTSGYLQGIYNDPNSLHQHVLYCTRPASLACFQMLIMIS